MRPPPQNLAEAIARLRESNDSLKRHLDASEQRKTIPPSPWEKSVEELRKHQPVRR